MKKIIIAPDSFKGTMSSLEICEILDGVVGQYFPDAEIINLPIADGGEGTVDSFLAAAGGWKKTCTVSGPKFQRVEAKYGMLNKTTAVVEMAAAAGLPLMNGQLDVMHATTYGVGELINDAISSGADTIYIGLGGSATTDGATGAASALGVRFLDQSGKSFVPVGDSLNRIYSIDLSQIRQEVRNTRFIAMCDIDNPLCGEQGAAHVFGPQKGAAPEMIEVLDKGLENLAHVIRKCIGKDVIDIPGAGAAGGMGAGLIAFFNAETVMGINALLDVAGFDQLLEDTAFILTGEGKLDQQSLHGKVVIGIARRAKKNKVPLFAIVGDIGDQIEEAYSEGVSGIFSINRLAVPFLQAKLRSKEDMRLTADNLLRVLSLKLNLPE